MPIPIRDQFSAEQKLEIKKLFDEGKTQKEIAQIFGVPRRTIMKLFKHLGLKRNHKEAQEKNTLKNTDSDILAQVEALRKDGKTFAEMHAITGKSYGALSRLLKVNSIKKPDLFDGIDDEDLMSDYDNGMNLKQLAKKYGPSYESIRKRFLKLGVNLKNPLFPELNLVKKQKTNPESMKLPNFVDSKNWFENAYIKNKYSISEIAGYLNRSPGYVSNKLSNYQIQTRSQSESGRVYDQNKILNSYEKLGSASKVAKEIGCSIQNVLNVLRDNNIVPTTTSEMFSGEGNPFFGQTHDEETKKFCKKIGSYYGKKFWVDNPEYVEVVREKNKLIWSDLEKRAEHSKKIATLRSQGLCNSYKGVADSRFGQLSFDSSYELLLIEHLEKNHHVMNIERDFDLVEYDYNGSTRHFVPDFRVWLSNGDFFIVEVKSKWLQLHPKEHRKIYSAFGRFSDKFMVVDKEFGEVDDRIDLLLNPLDFDFNDVELRDVDSEDYTKFYAAFHYMGRTGRRGPTLGAYLGDKLIACCTISSITRKEMADRHNLTQGEVRELVRFCIHPDFHKKNFGSWFISRSIKKFKAGKPQVKLLISFADTTQQHIGTLYEASNWSFDGLTSPSYHYVDETGQQYHKKTVWNRAKKAGLTESVCAKAENLVKVKHLPKKRYFISI